MKRGAFLCEGGWAGTPCCGGQKHRRAEHHGHLNLTLKLLLQGEVDGRRGRVTG
jgi:hypothetical protein